MALQITIGGVDYTANVNFKSIRIQDSVEVQGDTLELSLIIENNSPLAPVAGQEIILTDAGTREFAGAVVSVLAQIREGTRIILYNLTCSDYTYYLNRRYVNAIYSQQRADLMIEEILDDLEAAADSETADGDQHYTDFAADKSFIKVGPVIKRQEFERLLPSQAFDVIAESAGMFWWVDFDKKVNLLPIQDSDAPVSPLEIDTNTSDYRNFELEEVITGVGTKAILQNTSFKSTDIFEDRKTWLTGDSSKFVLSRRPFSELDIVSVTRDGNTLTQILEDIEVDATAEPGTGNVAIYVGPTSYVRFHTADLVNNDALVVRYNYSVADDHESADPLTIENLATRTGGDGIHEFLFSKASGLAVTNIEDLDEISQILLDRKSTILVRGSFESFTKGWQAGQVLDIDWDSQGKFLTVYIITVQKTIRTPSNQDAGDNQILHRVQFSNVPRGMQL